MGFPPPARSPGPPAQKFADKTFAKGGNSAKFTKVFTCQSFRLYGTLQHLLYTYVVMSWTSTTYTVADPEGVPWIPWNPSFARTLIIIVIFQLAPFIRIRFHRETRLFCSVSAYRLLVNEQNAPGKRCVWKTHFKVDLFKNEARTSSCKREKRRNATLDWNDYAIVVWHDCSVT